MSTGLATDAHNAIAMGFAADLAHRVVFMDGGRILRDTPPAALLGRPRGARAGEFLGKVHKSATLVGRR